MSSLNDKYGRPILEDGTDPFFLKHQYRSNFIYSLYPRLRAERKATFSDSMMMIDLLLHKFEATYLPNQKDKQLLCMPYLFVEPPQGTKIRNKSTDEIYIVTDTLRNPITNIWEGLVRIDTKTPPNKDLSEKLEFLDEDVRVRFTAEYPRDLGIDGVTVDEMHVDKGPIKPTIVYALIRKEPASIGKQPFAPQKQYKSMFRERMRSPNTAGHSIEIFAQRFDILVEFGCFTTDNRSADLLVDWFEEFMKQYTWVLKYNGVQEILFWQRLRDDAVTKWRQDLISRTIQYYFRLEDIVPVIRRDMIDIDITVDVAKEIQEAGMRWIGGRYVTGQLTNQEYRDIFRGSSGEYLFGDLILNDGNLT